VSSALVFLGIGTSLVADIPGGPGKLLTPYSDPDHVTETQVSEAKAVSSRTREISHAELAATHAPVSGDQVALDWARGNALAGDRSFAFQGAGPDGQKIVADFSDISSIWLISVERHLLAPNEVILECKLFPAITPADLVNKKPTYSQLEDDHTNTVRIRLPINDSQKRDLCLIKNTGQRYEMMARIADLKPNSEIKFDYGRHRFGAEDRTAIWWAIGSVIKDPRYPHKLVFKK
jgi:hypothetical protein